MAAGDINDPLTNVPNVALVDQSSASAAPGAGYARLEVVNGVLGLRVGTGDWVGMVALTAGLLSGLTAKATPVAGDLLLLQDSEDSDALKKLDVDDLPSGAPGGGGLYDAVAIYSYTLPANSAGGGSTSGSWQTRPLNSEDADPQGIGTLASNQITLGPGSYYIDGWMSIAANDGVSSCRLYNATGAAVLADGSAQVPAAGVTSTLQIRAYVTLAVQSAVELQYRVTTSQVTYGLGIASNFGDSNVHAQVVIHRLAA